MAIPKKIDGIKLFAKPARDVRNAEDPIKDLLHRDLKKFTWSDLPTLSHIITPVIVGILKVFTASGPAPISQPVATFDVRDVVIDEKSIPPTKEIVSDIKKCPEVFVAESTKDKDKDRKKIILWDCTATIHEEEKTKEKNHLSMTKNKSFRIDK